MGDIIEGIRTLMRGAASVGDQFDKHNGHSIARNALDQTFQFQCLCDNTIPIDLMTVIDKNLDRIYASWTQMYLSSVGLIDLNYIKNPKQFVQKYQPRFNFESADDEDVSSFLETVYDESLYPFYGDDEVLMTESFDDHAVVAYIGKSENPPRNAYKHFQEDTRLVHEGINQRGLTSWTEATGITFSDLVDQAARESQEREAREGLRATRDARPPRMGDMDIKKLNDMAPYMLDLRLMTTNSSTSAPNSWVDFTVGVKTMLHPGDADKLEKNLVYVLQNKQPLFNFIRWTTGEISFVRDLLLHLDDINFDMANRNDKTGRFISALKRMKKKKVKFGTNGITRLAPQATIVISSSTYQNIKNNYGFDVKNITMAHKIMEELFLMCFVIIDDITRTVDMLVDGNRDFTTFSLETLEREVTMSSNKLGKELTRMLGT